MFSFVASALIATANPPAEFVIDCSSWSGMQEIEVAMRIEARDGTKVKNVMCLYPNTKGDAPGLGVHLMLKNTGWNYERLDDTKIIIRASKSGSAIRSVTFTSDVWKPLVTRIYPAASKIPLGNPK